MFHVKHLLADAKSAENAIQDIGLHAAAQDLIQQVHALLQMDGHQLGTAAAV
jgi:hypothetical protein